MNGKITVLFKTIDVVKIRKMTPSIRVEPLKIHAYSYMKMNTLNTVKPL